MPSNVPTKTITNIFSSWCTGKSFKACLVGSGWTPNRASTQFRSELTAHEITGTNWPAGGVAVSLTVTENTAANQTIMTIGSFTVANVTTTTAARYLVAYHAGGNAATDRITSWHDLQTEVIWTAEPFVFNAAETVATIGADR
jgi:hypothetical protein